MSADEYCVACGAILNRRNGVEVCKESSLGLSHLWARAGHVEDWFPHQLPARRSQETGETK